MKSLLFAVAFLCLPLDAIAQDTVVAPIDVHVIADTFLQSIMDPIITALSGLALVAITWLSAVFTKKTGLVIENQRKEALHSAIMTGVSAALKKLGAGASVDAVVRDAVAYARDSVPDAIAALKPDAAVLTNLAMSKLEMLLLGALKSDPTTTTPKSEN